MNVIIRDRQITFEPQFTDLRDVVMKCFTEIVGSAENIPRVIKSPLLSAMFYQLSPDSVELFLN